MADFMMHNTLVRDCLKDDKGNLEYALIGAQGPDYVYYVLKKKHQVKAHTLGNTLHNQDTKAFLLNLMAEAIKEVSEAHLAYCLGFLTHYALDVTLHPYIYYYTGLYHEHDETTHAYAGLHLRFERKVDVAFMQHHASTLLHKQALLPRVLPFKAFPDTLKKTLDTVIKKTYDVTDAGALFAMGYRTMRRVYRVFVHDPTTLKQRVLRLLESYKKPKVLYYQDLSHAQTITDFDYLNCQKNPWRHPVTGKRQTASVLELYEIAYHKAQALIEAAKDAYQKKDASLLASHLENASYDSGLPLEMNQTMSHFKRYLD